MRRPGPAHWRAVRERRPRAPDPCCIAGHPSGGERRRWASFGARPASRTRAGCRSPVQGYKRHVAYFFINLLVGPRADSWLGSR